MKSDEATLPLGQISPVMLARRLKFLYPGLGSLKIGRELLCRRIGCFDVFRWPEWPLY